MTATQALKALTARLAKALGDDDEGLAAARLIMEDVAGYDRRKIFTDGDRTLLPETEARLDRVAAEIEQGMPQPEAVGTAPFMDHDYIIPPDVKIPRPETDGNVDMVVDRYGARRDLRVLDIGTGSGCIAISLARALPFCKAEGIDISAAAVDVARRNAAALRVPVSFAVADILRATAVADSYDIIVSNPPYICRSERSDMDPRVADAEPDGALFVPVVVPLLIYRALAPYAHSALATGGGLFFEINSRFPAETERLLVDEGFEDVAVTRDYKGNPRYAAAVKA
ncbi:MAG: peptide chain release factor N(5)-glutamine methyltransferase [Muribaculaceae bacterium]|nr:peptide chain release factor N(5)-glutamine methyltransferase [Muribaculaceae bacterium]